MGDTGVIDRPVVVESRSGWSPALTVFLASLAVGTVRCWRTGDFRVVWAEDGFTFLADVNRQGLSSLIDTYGGYAHAVPRLLALVGSWLPLGWYAAYTTAAALLVTAALAAFVFTTARDLTGSRGWSAVAAGSLTLAPIHTSETLGNLANLQWFLLAAAVWALLARRERPVAATIVTTLAALTTPLLVFPVAAVLAADRVAWRRLPVRAAAVGLVAQFAAVAWGPGDRGERTPAFDPGIVAIRLLDRSLGPVLGTTPGLLAGAVVAALLVAALVTSRDRRAGALAVSTVCMFVAVCAISGSAPPRYSAATAMLLASALALAAPQAPRIVRGAALVAVALVAVVGVATFHSVRTPEPSWAAEVHDYRQACDADARTVHVEIQPPGTSFRLAC